MADSKKWLAVCRQLITEHHSKARKAWEGMNQRQRGVILHSAGLNARYCPYDWKDFNNRELLQLKRGIQRLRALADAFGAITDLDFVQPVLPVVAAEASKPEKASLVVQAALEARNKLKNDAITRNH